MHLNLKITSASSSNSIIWLYIGTIIIWLFWSASIIGIETGDGYSVIITSQYFLGLHEDFGFQRGPFLALYHVPAEWLSNVLKLHPLDVRIHHYLSALLHSLYIIFSWIILKRYYRVFDWPVAVAFIASIPSFIFFSYAVFISSDIYPGLILISMIFFSHSFNEKPNINTWLYLVILGFIAVIIKQTYAIFWISILISSIFVYPKKINFYLLIAATLSAILSYLAYAWFLQGSFLSDSSWWLSPLNQISFINNLYATQNIKTDELFVWWLYLRNFYNYGIFTSILILPAIFYIIFQLKKNDKLLYMMALVWLLSIALLQIITFKEVRYLEFLAPLSAFLLVPLIRFLNNSRYKYYLIALITASLAFDLPRNFTEALRIHKIFYRVMVTNFIQPLDTMYINATQHKQNDSKIVMVNHIGFTPNLFSPLKGDRYHRTFHIPNHALKLLYNFNNLKYHYYTINDENDIDEIKISYELFSEGDLFIFSNQTPYREPPWDALNLSTLKKNYVQIIAIAKNVTLYKKDSVFHISSEDNQNPLLIMNNKNNNFRISISHDTFDLNEMTTILGKEVYEKPSVNLTAFKVTRFCNNKGCYDMNDEIQSLY